MDAEDQMEQYLEAFYDEKLEPKIVAAKNMLMATMQHQNLEFLIQHEQFLSTIAIVLRDEHKKSNELTLYLMCCFYILSNYAEFHVLLGEHQIGDITMKVIENQIQRFDLRYAELMEKTGQQQAQELRKLNLMIAKQEKIFYVGFTILMNLAEDPIIENKMRKRKIITFMLRMLERNNFYLLIVTLLFLKKMSIVSECKQQMVEEGLVRKLKRFFSADNQVLLQLSLSLMKNICFDSECRSQMEQAGYIPEIAKLLKAPNFRFLSIVLLYQLSLDDKIRFTFGFTDCMSLVIKLILHFPEPLLGKELMGLAINLSLNSRNVDHITEQEISAVIQRALQNQDILLLRFVKGVLDNSTNAEVINAAKQFVRHFIKMLLTQGKEDDLKFELIGILTALQLEDQWIKYVNESFLEFIHNNLATGMVDDDIILETLMLVSALAQNAKVAEIMAKNRILQEISQLYIEKADDDEFIVQYLYCLHRFLVHKLGIEFILEQEDILMQMLNSLNDKNLKVRAINGEVLDLLREYDHELSEKIKETKFFEYNLQWVEHVNDQEYEMMQDQGDLDLNEDYAVNGLDPRMWDSDND